MGRGRQPAEGNGGDHDDESLGCARERGPRFHSNNLVKILRRFGCPSSLHKETE
jgi:hypothetical protein